MIFVWLFGRRYAVRVAKGNRRAEGADCGPFFIGCIGEKPGPQY